MASPEQAPQWIRLGPEERREAILAVASRHFAERPYEAVSTSEIASEAGVNRGLIHHYIGTKRELFLEVLRRSLYLPAFPSLELAGGTESLEPILSKGVDAWLSEVEANRGAWLAASRMAGGFGRDPEVEELVRQAREAAIENAMGLEFDPAVAPPAVRGVLSALGGLATQTLVEWLELKRLDRAQAHAVIVSAALNVWRNFDKLLAGRY